MARTKVMRPNSVVGPETDLEAASAAPDPLDPSSDEEIVSENGAAVEVASDQIAPDQIDDVFKELKTLLSTVEKLQKARSEVGDIKPQLLRLLDGELLSGDELEQLKAGVGGLAKLVRLYGDYQVALENAQPARELLDQVIK